MTFPFPYNEVMKVPRELPSRPDVPRGGDHHKDHQIFPSQKPAKSKACFAIKDREKNKNRRRVDKAEYTFAQAGECRADPEPGEPSPSLTAALIAAQRTEDPASQERADERLRHDNAGKQECTAAAEINKTCNETVPVPRKFFPN